MKRTAIIKATLFLTVLLCNRLHSFSQNLVYVDKQGVMRWTSTKKEASFFGVNYTVPFAYGYRSHKALGKDLKRAIDDDVYHMSRLGLDAFRVHMWDVEITDSTGNLLQNEHLDLFDYLLYQLQRRNIYVIITPIAFWGNGYPERDEKTSGFSSVYGKDQSVVKEVAIKAQENYLAQLMNHVNPYSHKTYKDDPNIIAAEINNEPHHSGPKEKTTEYVNRLAASIRGTGWTKPIFYNISESPWYSDAVAKSNVEGHSFQWYPSGLVANHEQKGNFLPNVDRYTIPFDSVPEFRTKAKMVYEFDAADILQSNMYPAMARSYRTAGFQWCTQFAYDPLATAYGNTEYQTHFLNLAYTPSKAISLLIASKVFHNVPRLKNYGAYPLDTTFEEFRVSYKNNLSEMNGSDEFYYSNPTSTVPLNSSKLKHIAGVGNSPIVQYDGSGAYFLDKVTDGVWRLEVMPDAIQVRDPFERASPKKEVIRMQWGRNNMTVSDQLLPKGFIVFPLVSGLPNTYTTPATEQGSFLVYPGVYILHNKNISIDNMKFAGPDFVAPDPFSGEVSLLHYPAPEISVNKSFDLIAKIAGVDTTDKITLELRTAPRWRTIPFKKISGGVYSATIPSDAAAPGVLNYRITIQRGNDYIVFPGGIKGNPFAWDNTNNDTYQTIVASATSGLEIFNTNTDRGNIIQYNPDFRNNNIRFTPSDKGIQLAVSVNAKTLTDKQVMGWQFYFGDKTTGRQSELTEFKNMVVRVRSESSSPARISLITKDAFAFSTDIKPSTQWQEIRIPLKILRSDSMLLLPRPYPGFLPLWFKASGIVDFKIEDAEKLQVICVGENKEAKLEVTGIWLEK